RRRSFSCRSGRRRSRAGSFRWMADCRRPLSASSGYTKRIKMKYYRVVAILVASLPLAAAGPQMTVYKTRTCGCCAKWVEHLRANGFDITVEDVPSTAEYRQKYGVPEKLASCHTGVVKGYAIEGHVPASDITRLLKT